MGGPADPVTRWKPSGEADFTSRPYKLTIWERAFSSGGRRKGQKDAGGWFKKNQHTHQGEERNFYITNKSQLWTSRRAKRSRSLLNQSIHHILPSWKGSPYSIAMPPSEMRAVSLKTLLHSSLESSCCVWPLCVRQSSFLPVLWQRRSRRRREETKGSILGRCLQWPSSAQAKPSTALLSGRDPVFSLLSLAFFPPLCVGHPPPSLPLCLQQLYLSPDVQLLPPSLPCLFSHLCMDRNCNCESFPSLQINMWELMKGCTRTINTHISADLSHLQSNISVFNWQLYPLACFLSFS